MIETPVSITLHFAVNGHGEVTLRIEDERSHQTFLTVDLTPEQFRNALAGSITQYGPIAQLGGLDRVGKYHRHQSTTIKLRAADTTDRSGPYWREVPCPETAQEIADWYGSLPEVEGGWTLDDLRRNNNTCYVVTARAFTTDPEETP